MRRKASIFSFMLLLFMGLMILSPWGKESVYANTDIWYPMEDVSVEWDESEIVVHEPSESYGKTGSAWFSYLNSSDEDIIMKVSSSNKNIIKIDNDSTKITLSAYGEDYAEVIHFRMVGTGITTIKCQIGDSVYTKKVYVMPDIDIVSINQTGATTAKITWEKDDSVDGYVIERKLVIGESEYGEYEKVKEVTKNVSKTTITAEWDKEYIYLVKSYYQEGDKRVYVDGESCDGKRFLFRAERMGAQIQSIEQEGTSSLKIIWNKEEDASYYKLYRSETENDNYKCVFTSKSANTTSYKQKVTKGKTYHYYLVTYFDGKKSNPSDSVSQIIQKNSSASLKPISGISKLGIGAMYFINWATPDRTAYYYQDGKLHIVTAEEKCVVDYTLSSSGKVISKKKISIDYELYGGFYKGTDGKFYVAVGYENLKQSKNKTVIKVIQYTNEWKKLKTAVIKGRASNVFEGIYKPFCAGNCSMEMDGDKLYVYTAREMFENAAGEIHQSNISFVIDTKTMKAKEANESYVSHSFNQLVKFKDGNLYLVDHGDALPRSIRVTIVNNYGDTENQKIIESDVFDFMGASGDNYTGCEVAGMAVGKDNIIVTGISVPHWNKVKGITGYGYGYAKNVYITITDKETGKSRFKWITTYNPKTTNVYITGTRIIKLTDDKFAILYSTSVEGKSILNYVVINDKGEKLFSTKYSDIRFTAGSQPILYNGKIVWADYIRKGETTSRKYVLCSIPAIFEKEFVSNGNKYEIISSDSVKFIGISSSSASSVTIPKTVKYGGTTYKVTSIGKESLKGNTTVKTVTVGENVKIIGASAFNGCTSLKTITIKSTKLTTVGKNALKNINSKATIKVPKSKLKSYKTLFKNKGQGKNVKIVEIK